MATRPAEYIQGHPFDFWDRNEEAEVEQWVLDRQYRNRERAWMSFWSTKGPRATAAAALVPMASFDAMTDTEFYNTITSMEKLSETEIEEMLNFVQPATNAVNLRELDQLLGNGTTSESNLMESIELD